MERSLDSAHSVRCARDDKGQSLPPLGSRRKRRERVCPGLCPASVSVTVSVAENCEWGMEETVLGMPLVVENRPFMLVVRKSVRDLRRGLERVYKPRDA